MPDSEEQQSEILQDVVGLLVRRRWWIVFPAAVTALAAIGASYFLPNRYESEATILVVQQRVPERYVTPTSSTDQRSLDAMTQDVLSRTQLLSLIEELSLYTDERKRLAPEQLVELIRQNISITPVQTDPLKKEIDALRISFTAGKPLLAQQVTSRLTTLFIQQNLKTREDQANTTTKFLHEQLEAAGNKLADLEQRLRDFKMENLGELPEQQQGNVAILASLQSQLQNVSSNLSRALQQKLYLESLVAQYQRLSQTGNVPVVPGTPAVQVNAASPIEIAERELAQLRSERDQLLVSYTPKHPAILIKDQQILKKQALIQTLKAAEPSKTRADNTAPESPDGKQRQPKDSPSTEGNAVLAQLRSQLDANRLEIQNLTQSEQQLKQSVAQYEARLNLTPVREQQLTSLLRDYDLTKKHYADLLDKEQQSQLAKTLEKEQEGQQFRMVDPPSLPAIPSSPKRLKIALGGVAGGIFLGLALAFLRQKIGSSLYLEKHVSKRFELPLIVGVPHLATRAELRRKAFRTTFEWIAGSALLLVVCAAEFYVFRHG